MSTNTPDRYTSLFTSHNLALWEYDPIENTLNFLNDYFQLLKLDQAGISFSDINGLRSVIHPEDLAMFDENIKLTLSGKHTDGLHYRMVSPSGEVVWLEDYLSSHIAENGNKQILAYSKNIVRKREKIEEKERNIIKYKTLLDAIFPDFIFVLDRDFVFQDIILPAGLNLFHKPEELIGKNADTIFSPEIVELFSRGINECLDSGTLKDIEYYLDLLGNRYYYQAHIVPYSENTAFALITDISDRVRRINSLVKARQQAEEANRMKTTFLANMSHEIRTPLNAIVGFSELIGGEDVEESDKEQYLQVIRSNNELLLKLVNDILDLSRIESGKSEFVFQNVNLYDMIEEIKQVHNLKVNTQIELKAIYPSRELCVRTDPNRTRQILYNFLSNAIKNTKKGSITLGVEETDQTVRIFVRDTGCGIPKDRLSTIFNRFEKVNDFVQGTGLGLSICTTLAKRLGGYIDVESTLGEGSTFSFYLPNQTGDEESEFTDTCEKEHDKREKKLILIVEDSEESYYYAKDILKEKYDVIQAKSGNDAYNSVILKAPDLILMSILLPTADALEGARKIREVSPKVPIVGITSRDFYTEQKLAMEAGYTDIIHRPYSISRLREAVIALI